MAIDISKNQDWFAQVKLSGNPDTIKFNGSIQQILIQAGATLKTSDLRIGRNGAKSIELTIQNQPFTHTANHGLPQDFMDAIDLSDVELLTEEQMTERFGKPPEWHDDPQYKQWRFYQASHSNYITAMPGEIQQLKTTLLNRYQNVLYFRHEDGERVRIEDVLIDRRA